MVPSNHVRQSTTSYDSSCRKSNASGLEQRGRALAFTCIYLLTDTLVYIIKKKIKFKICDHTMLWRLAAVPLNMSIVTLQGL